MADGALGYRWGHLPLMAWLDSEGEPTQQGHKFYANLGTPDLLSEGHTSLTHWYLNLLFYLVDSPPATSPSQRASDKFRAT
jgi:hypothetical protein